jgi:Helix-turn-helix domain, rpiR family
MIAVVEHRTGFQEPAFRYLRHMSMKHKPPRLSRDKAAMRQVSSLIDTMRLLAPEMSRAERNVANIILSDVEAATRISTKSLAAQAEVSEPTIIRFARRMGCDGFTDFKIRLAQDYALGRMYITAERQEPAKTGWAVAEHVYEATAQALDHIAWTANTYCWHGSEIDLGILEAMYVHQSAGARSCVWPGDIFGRMIRKHDLLAIPLTFEAPYVRIPTDGTGLGVRLDEEAIAMFRVAERVIS